MKEVKISVAGSVGALPSWIMTVQGIHRANPGSGIGGKEPAGGIWPVAHEDGLVYHAVRTEDGLPATAADGVAMVLIRENRGGVEQPGVVEVTPPPRDRPTRGRRKSWWPW
jgi:hypothetical protein